MFRVWQHQFIICVYFTMLIRWNNGSLWLTTHMVAWAEMNKKM